MAGEVIAGLAESNGSLNVGFMASVTCIPTADDRDQLRNPTLASSMGQGGICWGDGGHVLITEYRGMALNGLFCADVLYPLDLTDFTYKYHPGMGLPYSMSSR